MKQLARLVNQGQKTMAKAKRPHWFCSRVFHNCHGPMTAVGFPLFSVLDGSFHDSYLLC